jgi:hypothetical protein
MSRRLLTLCVITSSLLLLSAPKAHATRFSLLGGAIFSKPSDEAGTFHRAAGWGLGMSHDWILRTYSELNSGTMYFLGLELGAFYFQRKFRTIADTTYDFTSEILQGQLLLRFWMSKVISLGVGGYYGITLGRLRYESPSGDFESSYARSYDYGAIGSFRITFPQKANKKRRWFVDARYSFGFVSVVSSGYARYEDAQILLGIRFGVSPRERHSDSGPQMKLPDY